MYSEIIKAAHTQSSKAFLSLATKLGLDTDFFISICDIPIEIEETASATPIVFNPKEYKIIISKEIASSLNENSIIPLTRELLYQMILANRTLLVQGGLLNNRIEKRGQEEFMEWKQLQEGHDLNKYKMLLSAMSKKSYTKHFHTYIPIAYIQHENGTYSVLGYNKQKNDFERFDNQKIQDIDQNPDIIMQQLGKALNENIIEPSEIIHTFDRILPQNIGIACDFYHQFHERLVDLNEIPQNANIEKVKGIFKRRTKKIKQKVNNQRYLEEAIAKALTDITLINENNDKLDISTTTSLIINSPISIQEKAGALLISQMGEEMLKWYMLSAYQITYQDKFAEAFKDDYDSLLKSFAELNEHQPQALNKMEQIVYKRKESFAQVFPTKKTSLHY